MDEVSLVEVFSNFSPMNEGDPPQDRTVCLKVKARVGEKASFIHSWSRAGPFNSFVEGLRNHLIWEHTFSPQSDHALLVLGNACELAKYVLRTCAHTVKRSKSKSNT